MTTIDDHVAELLRREAKQLDGLLREVAATRKATVIVHPLQYVDAKWLDGRAVHRSELVPYGQAILLGADAHELVARHVSALGRVGS